MLKKPLIRTEILKWLEQENLTKPQDIQTIFDRSRELYDYIKSNPNFPDLIPEKLGYVEFMTEMEEGVKIAQDPQYGIFRRMKNG